jgi:hypothetical protein
LRTWERLLTRSTAAIWKRSGILRCQLRFGWEDDSRFEIERRNNMVYLIIVFATLSRFIPHLWNFSPVYGALLFGGANMKKRDSIWFSAVTLGASDIVLTKFIYHLNVGWGELIHIVLLD